MKVAKMAARVPLGSSSMRMPACAMFTVPTDAYTSARANRKTMDDAMETMT